MVVSALSVAVMLASTDDAVIWTCVIIFGLGMASTYPTALTLVEQYVNLSGKIASVLVVGGALGEMAVPLVLVALFGAEGDNLTVLIPVLVAVSFANLFVLGTFVLVRLAGVRAGRCRVGVTELTVRNAAACVRTPPRPRTNRQVGRPVLAAKAARPAGIDATASQYELAPLDGADPLDGGDGDGGDGDGGDGGDAERGHNDDFDLESPVLTR